MRLVEAQPWAIAMGDFNGDKIQDLATGNSWSNDVSILLGLGDGTFQKQETSYLTGEAPGAIVAADFNGDGHLDLAVGNASSKNVSLLLGLGDGTFQLTSITWIGQEPGVMTAGDFDGDTRWDLVVPGRDGHVWIFCGAESGTFSPPRKLRLTKVPNNVDPNKIDGIGLRSMAVADLNKDGLLDVAATVKKWDAVAVWLADGQGDFRQSALVPVGGNPGADGAHSVVLAHFNHDGNLDLATANDSSDTVSVRFGKGDGTFQQAGQEYDVGDVSEFIVKGDFNDDGFPDLATGNEDSRDASILMNQGDGTFREQSPVPVYYIVDELAAADFNRDGHLDLAAVSREDEVVILLGLGDGAFQDAQTYSGMRGPETVAIGDFDLDGDLDLAVANESGNTLSVLMKQEDGTFEEHEMPSFPLGLALRDDLDLAANPDAHSDADPDAGLARLRLEFATHGILLSQHASVASIEQENAWVITDAAAKYKVRNEEHGLNVYPEWAASQGMSTGDVSQARTLLSGGTGPVDAVVTHANFDSHLDLIVAHSGGEVSLLSGTDSGFGGDLQTPSVPSARFTAMKLVASEIQDGTRTSTLALASEAGDALISVIHVNRAEPPPPGIAGEGDGPQGSTADGDNDDRSPDEGEEHSQKEDGFSQLLDGEFFDFDFVGSGPKDSYRNYFRIVAISLREM